MGRLARRARIESEHEREARSLSSSYTADCLIAIRDSTCGMATGKVERLGIAPLWRTILHAFGTGERLPMSAIRELARLSSRGMITRRRCRGTASSNGCLKAQYGVSARLHDGYDGLRRMTRPAAIAAMWSLARCLGQVGWVIL
jgi:hypothetical protein